MRMKPAITLAAANKRTRMSARNASCWLAYCPPTSRRIPGGGGLAAKIAFTSFMTALKDRSAKSAVIAIFCC